MSTDFLHICIQIHTSFRWDMQDTNLAYFCVQIQNLNFLEIAW